MTLPILCVSSNPVKDSNNRKKYEIGPIQTMHTAKVFSYEMKWKINQSFSNQKVSNMCSSKCESLLMWCSNLNLDAL